MAQKKITDLVELTSFAVDDVLLLEDTSAGETKKIQSKNLLTELYYSGSKVLSTRWDGVSIQRYDDATHKLDILFDTVNWVLTYDKQGAPFILQGADTGGTTRIMFLSDPDGAANLYYAGTQTVKTHSQGMEVGNGTYSLRVAHDGWAKIISLANGAPVYINGLNASGVEKNIVNGDPDGAANMYYAGVKALYTSANGCYFSDGTDLGELALASGSLYFKNLNWGGNINIAGCNTSGTYTSLIVGDPDAAIDLYYAGSKKLETLTSGVKITGYAEVSPTNGVYFGDSNTDGSWRMLESGGGFYIQKRVSGTWTTKANWS